MDESLRNGLWNVLYLVLWKDVPSRYVARPGIFGLSSEFQISLDALSQLLWLNYFKIPLDEVDREWGKNLQRIREHYFKAPWFEVYNFLEFICGNFRDPAVVNRLITNFNIVLEREVAGYRFVGGLVTPISAKVELDEIELALKNPLDGVREHLHRALDHLSRKVNPDYRNSIKESISAVECVVKRTLDDDSGTLGQLLGRLESNFGMHKSLIGAFEKLYGYTSDKSGIRHAIMDKKSLRVEDAQFFIVVCSAFINHVQSLNSRGDTADSM